MSRKFDYLGDVEVFMAVAEHGSFSAGAVALSTTPSVLSRAVSRLEARLGRQPPWLAAKQTAPIAGRLFQRVVEDPSHARMLRRRPGGFRAAAEREWSWRSLWQATLQ